MRLSDQNKSVSRWHFWPYLHILVFVNMNTFSVSHSLCLCYESASNLNSPVSKQGTQEVTLIMWPPVAIVALNNCIECVCQWSTQGLGVVINCVITGTCSNHVLLSSLIVFQTYFPIFADRHITAVTVTHDIFPILLPLMRWNSVHSFSLSTWMTYWRIAPIASPCGH